MNCRQVRDGLPLYVGCDLTDAERTPIEEHLTGCAECRAQLERFSGVFAPLKGLAPVDAPVPDAERLWAGITRDMGWNQDAAPRRTSRRPLPSWVRAGLRVAAVFALGIGLGYASTRLTAHRDTGRSDLAAARPDFTHPLDAAVAADPRPLPVVGDFNFSDVQPVDTSTGGSRRFFMRNIFPAGQDRAPTGERENRFHLEQIRTVHGEELIAGY